MRFHLAAAFVLSGLIFDASPQAPVTALNTTHVPWLDEVQVTQVVNGLGRCAGVYEVAARLNDDPEPAIAKTWRDTARGARFAAMYLLSMERSLSTGQPKKTGDFASYVDPIIETSTAQIQVFVENNDSAAVMAEMDVCIPLMEIQKELVQRAGRH